MWAYQAQDVGARSHVGLRVCTCVGAAQQCNRREQPCCCRGSQLRFGKVSSELLGNGGARVGCTLCQDGEGGCRVRRCTVGSAIHSQVYDRIEGAELDDACFVVRGAIGKGPQCANRCLCACGPGDATIAHERAEVLDRTSAGDEVLDVRATRAVRERETRVPGAPRLVGALSPT